MKRKDCAINGEESRLTVEIANNFFARFRGLMFKKNMERTNGLLIVPCNQIHTFNMKFDMDAVYLDKGGCVIRVDPSLPPGKTFKTVRGGKSVLELGSGAAAEFGIEPGAILTFTERN